MSLIYCPECGHEISNVAVACPNCGRPINKEAVAGPDVVVAERPERGDGVPKWIFIPLALIAALVMVLFFALFNRESLDDEANTRVRINAANARPQSSERTTTDMPPQDSATYPSSAPSDSQTVNVPGSQTTVSDKGTAIIEAKVIARNGSHQAVKGQRFYLLDEDVETILRDADIEPIDGQTLLNSFGLAVMSPERYPAFNRNAFRAIQNHIKYTGQTDAAGKAQLGGIEPKSYYVFGIAKAGNGFAVWSAPVSVLAGENVLTLSPQTINEIEDTSG